MKKYLFLLLPVLITTQSYTMDDIQDPQMAFFLAVSRNYPPQKILELLKNPAVSIDKLYNPAYNIQITEGYSPLHIAASEPHLQGPHINISLIRLLLGAGANINTLSAYGQTALFQARSPEIAVELLKQGIDPSIRDKGGRTALESLAESIKTTINKPIFGNIPLQKLAVKNAIEEYIQRKTNTSESCTSNEL